MGKKNFSRRDFLAKTGAAGALALPLLNSQVAMGQTTTAPTRLLIIPLQHGWGVDRALAPVTGSEFNYNLPAPLQAFNSVKDQCVVVDAVRTGFWGNAHDVSYSDILTCAVSPDAPVANELGGPFFNPQSPSLDYTLGNHFNKGVLRFSHWYRSFGASHHAMSFDANRRSLPYYLTARDAYMGVIDPLRQMTTPPPAGSQAANNALFSMLGGSTQALMNRLPSGNQRNKVQSYFNALNALGNRVLNPNTTGSGVVLPPLPGMNLAFNDQLDRYLEMIKICFQLDTHRVAVLGLGEGVNNWTWNDNGTSRTGNTFGSDFHHDVAHYTNAQRASCMAGWTNWYSQKIAAFIQSLKTTMDVDGRPMIDNTIIVLTGEVGNGNHEQRLFTHLLFGGGGQGRIRRNRWIQLPTFDPRNRGGVVWGSRNVNGSLLVCDQNYGSPVSRHHLADLWVSVMRLMGMNINTFGFDVYNYQPIQLT